MPHTQSRQQTETRWLDVFVGLLSRKIKDRAEFKCPLIPKKNIQVVCCISSSYPSPFQSKIAIRSASLLSKHTPFVSSSYSERRARPNVVELSYWLSVRYFTRGPTKCCSQLFNIPAVVLQRLFISFYGSCNLKPLPVTRTASFYSLSSDTIC